MESTLDGKLVGPRRGAKGYKKWIPKEWRPEYEAIVALSCTGLSNEEVGRRFNYGKQQVSNILNTPQAREVRRLITERLHNSNTLSISERVEKLQSRALEHVEYILDKKTEDFKNPLAIFDRSLAFLKSSNKSGFTPDNSNGHPTINNITQTNIRNAMILGHSESQTLNEGLNKANEVKQLHDGSIGHNNTKFGKSDG